MRLSIVIPVYNAENYINRCLQSIINSGISDYEIICVDDGSTDNSYNLLLHYALKYPNISVFKQKNSFAGIARNFGMKYAKGDYIHFMDIDDEVTIGSYETVLSLAEELDVDYLKVKAHAIDSATGQKEENEYYELSKVDKNCFNCVLTRENGVKEMIKTGPTPWAAIIKRRYIFKQKLLFNNLRCANDRSFFMGAISHTDRLAFCNEVLVRHYINNENSLVGIRHKYFDCNIKSYEFVENNISDVDESIRLNILRDEMDGIIVWYLRLTEEEQKKNKPEVVSFLSKKGLGEVYPLIGKRAFEYLNLKLDTIDQLNDKLESEQNIVIYGAGKVTEIFLQWLTQNKLSVLKKVKCILVRSLQNNPKELFGIPVCELNRTEDLHNAEVIVATREKFQRAILEDLADGSYLNISLISTKLYDNLSFENNYYHNSHLQPHEYEQAIKDWYQEIKGVPLNLDNPQTFNEKIQWIKLHGITPHITRLTDKYLVREWIKEQIGEEYLVPLLGVWNSFDEIDIDALPKRFALKCNHGCDWNSIVRDKDAWDVVAAKKNFDKWMQMNFAFRGGLQLQYKDIVPKIIAEEYLENADGDLYDYKFWCFNGKVEFVMFLSERAKELRMNNYDRNWNLLPFTYDHPNTDKPVAKPEKLEEMIVLAEKLAAGFPHVRVDFYQLNDGTIKFGEMTFTSCNGRAGWSDETVNRRLGELIPIPVNKIK